MRLFQNVPPNINEDSHCCQAKLYHHGHYERTAVTKTEVARLKIYRFQCSLCGTTFSYIPDFLVPYQVFYTGVQEAVFYRKLVIGKSVAAIKRRVVSPFVGISERTIKRWVKKWRNQIENVVLQLAHYLLNFEKSSSPHIIIRDYDPYRAAMIITQRLWSVVQKTTTYPFYGFFPWLNMLLHP